MSRQSCPPVTWAAPPCHMTLEPYLRLAAFGTGAAELMLRQTGRRGQTVLVQFYDASDNGCGIISGLKHH